MTRAELDALVRPTILAAASRSSLRVEFEVVEGPPLKDGGTFWIVRAAFLRGFGLVDGQPDQAGGIHVIMFDNEEPHVALWKVEAAIRDLESAHILRRQSKRAVSRRTVVCPFGCGATFEATDADAMRGHECAVGAHPGVQRTP